MNRSGLDHSLIGGDCDLKVVQGLAQKFDKSLDDPSFKKSVDDFVKQRDDYITSDREAAAFMLANGLD